MVANPGHERTFTVAFIILLAGVLTIVPSFSAMPPQEEDVEGLVSTIVPELQMVGPECSEETPDFGAADDWTSTPTANSNGDVNGEHEADSQGGAGYARVAGDLNDFGTETVEMRFEQSGSGNAGWQWSGGGGKTAQPGTAASRNWVNVWAWDGEWTYVAGGTNTMAFQPSQNPGSVSGFANSGWFYELAAVNGYEYLGLWGVTASASSGNGSSASASASVEASSLEWCIETGPEVGF